MSSETRLGETRLGETALGDTELGDLVAGDSTLPRFAVPSDVRRWGLENRIAERNAVRATLMLLETVVVAAALVGLGEFAGSWWGWMLAWTGLVGVMMRVDAIHHEAVHRSLFDNRLGNDLVAIVTGAIEGFHAPIYRSFHLSHHALTRRDGDPSDPEDFYDEMLTRPMQLGPLRVPARIVYIVGNLIGGTTFALQLIIEALATLLGRPPAYVRVASLERHVRRWGWLPFVLWGSVIGGSIVSGHSGELLRWWVVPMMLFLSGPYTFFALSEHYRASHNGQMIVSTGSVTSNPLYRRITLDGNFHLAHHVFPTASWWWLPEADSRLRDRTELSYRSYTSFHLRLWRDMSKEPGTPSVP